MTDSVIQEIRVPDDRPPMWANSLMRWALTTPVLQSTVGKGVALLTFQGRHSDKTYTIPVSYHRAEDVVTIVTKRQREWWHNFETPHEVIIRLAGEDYLGVGEVVGDEGDMLEFMLDYLGKRPIDAKAYGLTGEVTREKVAAIVPQIVVIEIEINPTTHTS